MPKVHVSEYCTLLREIDVLDQIGPRAEVAPISDSAARTIASWWQAPDNKAITAFVSGFNVDADSLTTEVEKEISYAQTLEGAGEIIKTLNALVDWVVWHT